MKIGDRVKIKGNKHAFNEEIGIIIGEEYSSYDYQVKVDEYKSDWIPFNADELELIK